MKKAILAWVLVLAAAGSGYPQSVPAPGGLVSWWPGEGNAKDIYGTNNGVATGITYAAGEVGQALVFAGSSSSYVSILPSPTMNVGQSNGFTIELWCNPATTNASSPGVMTLTEWNSGSVIGSDFELYNGGQIVFGLFDTGNNGHVITSDFGVVVPNVWQHVAVTYDKPSGMLALYYNGAVLTNWYVGTVTPATAMPLYLGKRAAGVFAPIPYQGSMDEVSLYNRALSGTEIQAIYNAGTLGKYLPPGIALQPVGHTNAVGTTASFSVTATGTAPLSYQWSFNSTNLNNATNATLTLTNVQSGQAGNYMVTVSNPYGSTNSTTAILAIVNAPVIATFSPIMGRVGTNVTIVGTNFDPVAANNVVYFGAVKAVVTSASPTNLNVSVPAGATFAPIDVTVHGLTAYANACFLPTFAGAGILTNTSLATAVNWGVPASSGILIVGDLDGDGKPDILTYNGTNVSIFQNISTNGSLTTGSFAPRVDLFVGVGGGVIALADLTGNGRLDIIVPTGNSNKVSIFQNFCMPGTITSGSFGARVDIPVNGGPFCAAVRDLDGDGRPDIVVAVAGNSTNSQMAVLRNTGTGGIITTNSFAPAVFFAIGTAGISPVDMAIADVDGDGKPDVIEVNNGGGTSQAISVLRNTSTLGNISFAPYMAIPGLANSYTLAFGDLDGDSKLDMVVGSGSGGQAVSVFRNTSTVGSIAFASRVDFATGGWCNGVALGDLDGDGKPDVVAVTQSPSHLSLFKNNSTPGSFTSSSLAGRLDFSSGTNPNGASVVDLDGDGRPDVVCVCNNSSLLSVYQNLAALATPPIITVQPVNQTNNAGTTANFSVTASGATPLDYRWSFNGTNLNNATNATLTLTNVQPVQAGNYMVTVTNAYGSTNSTTVTLTVLTYPPAITSQPVSQTNNAGTTVSFTVGVTGTAPLSCQWIFNGTNLNNATNTTLTLTNVQPVQAGNYFVTITNSYGSTNSTTATLTVLTYPPTITLQPVSKTNNAGTPVSFTVAATGTAPLGYLWSLNGTNLNNATNATLMLTNVQPSQAGNYVVMVANPYGSTNSTTATLTVLTYPPAITLQPVGQTNLAGVTVNFSVAATGTAPLSYQWSLNGTNLNNATNTSLTLTNAQPGQSGNYLVTVTNIAGSTNSTVAILKINPPVSITPPSGLVSWWQGEGNANDSCGINYGVAASVTYANGEVGQAFVFSGANSYVSIPDSPSLHNITTNITFELWMKHAPISGGDWQGIVAKGNAWSLMTDSDNLAHLSIGGLSTSYMVSTRIINDGNWHHFAGVYDGTNIYIYVDGTLDVKQSATGLITQTSDPLCFGANPQAYVPSCGCNEIGYFYTGSIDEVSLYNRALSASEIQAIYNSGSLGKYFPPVITAQPVSQTNVSGATVSFSVAATGTAPLSYQWSLNGTNLTNATNATLTLTNVQPGHSGNYLVTVANPYAATNSSTAVLMVGLPPTITRQPQSQAVLSFNSVSFTVAASGSAPFNYQWRKNGTNLVDGSNVSGSTTTSLNLASVSPVDAGNYDVVVSNPYAASNSAVAVLTVPETMMTIGSTNAMSGSTIVVPVMMNALGMEYAFFGSVGYDPTKLSLQGVQLGQATAGAYLQEVDTQTNNGYVGFAIILNFGSTIPAGTQEVANLVFKTLPVTNNTTVNLTFGDAPTGRQIADNNLTLWPAIYQNGAVSLTPAEYAGDVYPRTNGDHQVSIQDWLEIGRMVAKIDVVTNSDEMLRADCAPRNNPNGKLTVADWVQAGRYALGLDPLTLVTTPSHKSLTLSTPKVGVGGTRTLQIGNVAAPRGQVVNVPVQLVSTADENAVGMTVGFNTSQLKLMGVALGAAATSGRLNVNTNQLTGEVGVALSLSPGMTLSPGTNEIVVLNFMTSSNASGSSPLTLDDSVVTVEVADKTANVLTASYVNGAVVLPLQPTIVTTATGTSLQLTWPIATGNFQVQAASNILGPWTTIVFPMVTNGGNVTATVPPGGFPQFYYRLTGQ